MQVIVELPPLQAEALGNLARHCRCSVGDLIRGLAVGECEGVERPLASDVLKTLSQYLDHDRIPSDLAEYVETPVAAPPDLAGYDYRLEAAIDRPIASADHKAAPIDQEALRVTITLRGRCSEVVRIGAIYDEISVEQFVAKAAMTMGVAAVEVVGQTYQSDWARLEEDAVAENGSPANTREPEAATAP